MGEKRNAYRLLVGKQREGDHYEDKDIDGWVERWDAVVRAGLVWLTIGTIGEPL
jgi:hypothetical protein